MRGCPVWGAGRCLLAAALIAGVVFAGEAVAQSHQSGELPAVLRGLPQAGNMCGREELRSSEPPVPGAGSKEAPVMPDLACGVSVTALKSELGKTELVLIDVRPSVQYDAFRIPGSANVSLPALRSKPYWQSKRIVLVGKGTGEQEVYLACSELKRRGFSDVRVLQGGMITWVASGGQTYGSAPVPEELAMLDAPGLWRESRFGSSVVLLDDSLTPLRKVLPHAMEIPEVSVSAVTAALQRHRKGSRGGAPSSVIVVSAGLDGTELRKLQRALLPLPLLVYRDSAQALEAYVRTQSAVWAARERGPKQPRCGA